MLPYRNRRRQRGIWFGFLITWVNVAAAHILWVQFDGSLRPPSDPGFSVASLGRIGTAAASCHLGNDNNKHHDIDDSNTILWWLGGKALKPGSLNNSAQAEYEGLLMGLEKAVELAELQRKQKQPTCWHFDKIIVQGDCKTVLDQLAESSRPRKLEPYYVRAKEYLNKLEHINVEYQHIPRDQNKLCDGLCTTLRAQIIEPTEWQRAVESVTICDQQDSDKDLSHLLQDVVRPGSFIPNSKRPEYYAKLSTLARQQGEYEVLVRVGECMEQEAKTVWSSSRAKHEAKKLQAWGIALQIKGLEGMGKKKSLKAAVAKERTNRFLLQQQKQWLQDFLQQDEVGSYLAMNDNQLLGAQVEDERHDVNNKALASQNARLASVWQAWLDHARHTPDWDLESSHWLKMVDDH